MAFGATGCRERLTLTLLGCLILIGASACTGGSSKEQPVAEATPTQSSTPTPDDPPASPSEEATPGPVSTAVCQGARAYNADSAPYAGKGPHRMTIVHQESGPDTLELRYVTLPDGWDPEIADDPTKKDRDKIELVVCDSAVPTGGVMGTCTFDQPGMSGKMDVIQADHTFVVRQARTGREVTRFSMPGTEGVRDSCPTMAMDSGGTLIAQAVDDDDVAAELRSLYEDPARNS